MKEIRKNFEKQCLAIEKEWYERELIDRTLAEQLKICLDAANQTETKIVLGKDTSLKHFIRSYRMAFQELVNTKITKEDLSSDKLNETNSERKKKGKSELSNAKFVNYLLRKNIKSLVNIQIGNCFLTVGTNPSASHLGNGFIKEIGAYADIWPVLNLITDCKKDNNQALAALFLDFADVPFEFTQLHLLKINTKFDDKRFLKTANYFCKFLTGIAALYVFFEPARRLMLEQGEKFFNVTFEGKIPIAANMFAVLKFLKSGDIDTLEDAFSPESQYILFTKTGVKTLKKREAETVVNNVYEKSMFRITNEWDKKHVSPTELRGHLLDPDSEEFDPTQTDTYEGDQIRLVPAKEK